MKLTLIALFIQAFILQGFALASEQTSQTTGLLFEKPRLIAQSDGAQNVPASDNADKADPNRPVRDKWAIVVGIGTFEKDSIPKLKFAAKDAKDFYDFLIKDANFAPDHVRLLLNEQATRKRILSELGNKFLARVADKDDLIVVYISTHGSPAQLDVRGKSYIVAYDSDPDDLYPTSIEMQEIADSISDRILSDRVLLVLDACHSGGITPVGKGIVRTANFDVAPIAMGSGQMVISSSQPEQQSWESKRYQNGVFTRRLLEGLRSSDGKNSITSAFNEASDLVQREVKEDYPGMRQTPVLSSKWKGDSLLLSVKPTHPEMLPDSVLSGLEKDSAGIGTRVTTVSLPRQQTGDLEGQRNQLSGSQTGGPAEQQPVTPQTMAPQVLKVSPTFFSNEPDPNAAYTSACQAQAAHFNETDFYYRKAKILIQLGKWGKAMQELKGCIVDNPQVADYYLARAYCFHRMGQEGQAQADLRQFKFLNVAMRDVPIEFDDH